MSLHYKDEEIIIYKTVCGPYDNNAYLVVNPRSNESVIIDAPANPERLIQIAEQTKAKAIITITYSGYNTIQTSSYRPTAFIYAFTNNHSILNTLSLVWGVQGFYYNRGTTTSQTIKETKEMLKQSKLLKKGDLVINIASMPAHEKGMTNMMKISKV